MFVRLLLLLTVIPIVELFVLLQVHGAIAERYGFRNGLLVTAGSVLLTGVLGAALARSQGLRAVRAIRSAMAQGRFPGPAMIDGVLVLVGGALLLTPGFLTDFVGLSFLIPMTRAWYRRGMAAWLRRKVERGEAAVWARGGSAPAGWGGPPQGRVIDVTPDDRD